MAEATFEDRISEFLEQSGVKGMKWGKSKGPTSPPKKHKATTDEIIGARLRQTVRAGALNGKAAATYMATTKKGKDEANKAYEKAESKFITHPDAITAGKMTKGEKAVTGIYLGLAAVMLTGYALAVRG